jgi:hypothetical protein
LAGNGPPVCVSRRRRAVRRGRPDRSGRRRNLERRRWPGRVVRPSPPDRRARRPLCRGAAPLVSVAVVVLGSVESGADADTDADTGVARRTIGDRRGTAADSGLSLLGGTGAAGDPRGGRPLQLGRSDRRAVRGDAGLRRVPESDDVPGDRPWDARPGYDRRADGHRQHRDRDVEWAEVHLPHLMWGRRIEIETPKSG